MRGLKRCSGSGELECAARFSYLGPKHMQRLARYPLEKAKTIMKMMYKASWANHTGRE